MIALALRYWWVLAIAGLVALLGVQEVRVARIKGQFADYRSVTEQNIRIASENARRQENRLRESFEVEAATARRENADLQTELSKLADTADGLRGDVAAWRRRSACASPGATNGGPGKPGADPGDLLTELYLGSVRTNQEIAEYAQRLRSAGLACERISESLRSPAKP